MPDSDKLQIILDEVRSGRDDMRSMRQEFVGEIRRVHERVDKNVSKINDHGQALAAAEARRQARKDALKKWSTIIGSIGAAVGLAITIWNVIIG